MKTNRRGFLGLFGAGVVSAPSVATANFQDMMNVPFANFSGFPQPVDAKMSGDPMDHKSWAKKGISRLLAKSPYQRRREKARFDVYQWDPNVVSLKSVNVQTRIRMSRDAAYERSERREYDYLDGVLHGFW